MGILCDCGYVRTDAFGVVCVGMGIADGPEYVRTDAMRWFCVGTGIVKAYEYSHTDTKRRCASSAIPLPVGEREENVFVGGPSLQEVDARFAQPA